MSTLLTDRETYVVSMNYKLVVDFGKPGGIETSFPVLEFSSLLEASTFMESVFPNLREGQHYRFFQKKYEMIG